MNEENATSIIYDSKNAEWLEFKDLIGIITTNSIENVVCCLQNVEEAVECKKYFAVGFVAYEAASAFDKALQTKQQHSDVPLLWFGIYKRAESIVLPDVGDSGLDIAKWEMSISRYEYNHCINEVKRNIYEGNTYQVNYTLRQNSQFKGDAFKLFCRLAAAQRAEYSAYIETSKFAVCSASPELFFTLDGNRIISKPMKGTAKRKLLLEDDLKQGSWLKKSTKNRSENVMILDMIRNDIGRIAKPGSVNVTELFAVEKYPTVWQMTSTVEARTECGVTEVFKALFPCASITGAPKANTMKIINELENTPRGLYTGAIGFMKPGKSCQFNVAIRTVFINKQNNIAEFGVGGGIVSDSTADDEFLECQTKAKFLEKKHIPFQLLESILHEEGSGYYLLNNHLKRLENAAEYFDYQLSIDEVSSKLLAFENTISGKQNKVRLLLSESGEFTLEAVPLAENNKDEEFKVAMASNPINTKTPFTFYKTTNRSLYNEFKKAYPEYYDIILWNSDGEVTESTFSNIVIKTNGELFTPCLKCGLLAGTFREHLLEKKIIKEKVIKIEELIGSDSIFLINSVRKWVKISLYVQDIALLENGEKDL